MHPAQQIGLGPPGAPSGGGGAGGRRGEPSGDRSGQNKAPSGPDRQRRGRSTRAAAAAAAAKPPGGAATQRGPERSGGPLPPGGGSQRPRSPGGARAGGARRPPLSPKPTRSAARATRAKRREPAAERMGRRGCGGSTHGRSPQRSEGAAGRAEKPGGGPGEPLAGGPARRGRRRGRGPGARSPRSGQKAEGAAPGRGLSRAAGPHCDPEAGPHTSYALAGGLTEARAADRVGAEAQPMPPGPGALPPPLAGACTEAAPAAAVQQCRRGGRERSRQPERIPEPSPQGSAEGSAEAAAERSTPAQGVPGGGSPPGAERSEAAGRRSCRRSGSVCWGAQPPN